MSFFRGSFLNPLLALVLIICLMPAGSVVAASPNRASAPALTNGQINGQSRSPVKASSSGSSWGFGSQYTLEGILTVHEEAITLTTADGRSFVLLMSGREAARFHDKQVRIEGLVHQADDLTHLSVKKIVLTPSTTVTAAPAPFKQAQTPPSLVRAENDSFVVKNVRWGRDSRVTSDTHKLYRFDVATIRPDKVKEVYFIKKPFPPEWIAAHSLFLFTFEPGGVVNEKGEEANGLVLTIEAYQRIDQSYSLVTGMKKQFGATWILATWQDYLEQSCRYGKEKMIPYRSILTKEQKQKLVRETIALAVVNRSGEYYHTITNNCTNNLVLLYNRVVEKARQVKLWTIPSLIYNFRATMPVLVPGLLIKKKLLEKPLAEINHENWEKNLDLED